MPPYEKNLLEEIAKLTQENNKILRGMQRAVWWGRAFGFVKWIVIIGLTVGAYYYVQPYLETLLKIYSNVGGGAEASSFGNLLKQVTNVKMPGF